VVHIVTIAFYLFLGHSVCVETPHFPVDLVLCVLINVMCSQLINFCINIKLFASIYDYLETSHAIQQEKAQIDYLK
jgi:hypothetical protein